MTKIHTSSKTILVLILLVATTQTAGAQKLYRLGRWLDKGIAAGAILTYYAYRQGMDQLKQNVYDSNTFSKHPLDESDKRLNFMREWRQQLGIDKNHTITLSVMEGQRTSGALLIDADRSHIILGSDMLGTSLSPAEKRAILAHELGHIAHKDNVRVSHTINTLLLGTVALRLGTTQLLKKFVSPTSLSRKTLHAIGSSYTAHLIGCWLPPLSMKGVHFYTGPAHALYTHQRQQHEFEADEAAVITGNGPGTLGWMLRDQPEEEQEVKVAQQKSRKSWLTARIRNTHPPMAQRIENVKRLMAEQEKAA